MLQVKSITNVFLIPEMTFNTIKWYYSRALDRCRCGWYILFFLNLSIITITCTIHREVWDLLHKFHLYLLIMNIYNALLKKGQKYLYFFQIINIKLANYQLFAVIFQASCNSFFSGDSNWAKSQSSILQGLLCSSQHNLCFHHSTH